MSAPVDIIIASAEPHTIQAVGRLLPPALFRLFAVQDVTCAAEHLANLRTGVLLFEHILIGGTGLDLCCRLAQQHSPVLRLMLIDRGEAIPRRTDPQDHLLFHDILAIPIDSARLVDTVFRWLDDPQCDPDPRTLEGAPGHTPAPLPPEEIEARTRAFSLSFVGPEPRVRHTLERSLRFERADAVTRVEARTPRAERKRRFSSAHVLDQKRFIEEIHQRYDALPSQDYWTLLGLPVGAPIEHVNAAFRALQRRFHPSRERTLRSPRDRHRLRGLHHLLVEAHAVLTHPERRLDYEQRRAEGALRLHPLAIARS